jgi:hypothetical protein
MAYYLISVLADGDALATEAEAAAIDDFNDQLRAEGQWVFAGGLTSPSTATVVDGRGADVMVTDGPYVESKEHVAGFWVVQATDPDVALSLASQGRGRATAGSSSGPSRGSLDRRRRADRPGPRCVGLGAVRRAAATVDGPGARAPGWRRTRHQG